ncbi:hypothetical protein DITRI_Ditri12bG0109300 [Diplodiscus trichospermus]
MAPTATRRLRNCYRRQDSSSNYGSSSRNNIAADKEDESNVEVLQTAGCSTPKGQRFRIPEILSCPPAPMKPRVGPKFLSRNSSAITFFAPPDIELFFFLAFQNVTLITSSLNQ